MSKTKKDNDRPSKYQELSDCELEVVCGGGANHEYDCSENSSAKYFIPETVAFTKTEAA
ncbi:hypothetical protein IQ255_28235 [Pleurocapsales cyanobacterium LEGE 10410]|nr:hypothetical protein [Pleurocapsales cyanobacterium LEGE 10410]